MSLLGKILVAPLVLVLLPFLLMGCALSVFFTVQELNPKFQNPKF